MVFTANVTARLDPIIDTLRHLQVTPPLLEFNIVFFGASRSALSSGDCDTIITQEITPRLLEFNIVFFGASRSALSSGDCDTIITQEKQGS
jgi:hypothetical protein